MPTYQYACTDDACGLRFERVQSFTDDAITECPTCSHRVRKVYGSVGVVFKGSGFYRNDSRETAASATPAAKSESSGESGAKSEKSGSDAAKSDSGSKPAAPAADKPAAKAPEKSTSGSAAG